VLEVGATGIDGCSNESGFLFERFPLELEAFNVCTVRIPFWGYLMKLVPIYAEHMHVTDLWTVSYQFYRRRCKELNSATDSVGISTT
jgi:hypothetical protein